MAYSPIEESYMNGYVATQFTTPEPEMEPTLLASADTGVTTDGGAFVGTRLNVPKPGQPTPEDRSKMAVGLLDTLAGALRGAAAQTIGLPGDIRSILDLINKEGADKYLGQAVLPTTEDMLAGTFLPPVLKEGVPNREERQGAVETAQQVGTFLPAPGVPEAVIQGGKLVGKAVKATKNMPIGMSTQMVGQGVDELGFYSAAKQAVDAIQQPKGTGEQFLKQIEKTPGVKPDEIKWTGLDEFLQFKKSVTKAEVQEYLDKNRVQIKEVKLGEPDEGEIQAFLNDEMGQGMTRQDAIDYLANDEGSLAPKFSKYTLPGGENYREVLLTLPSKMLDRDSPEMIKAATEAYGEKSLPRLSDSQWQLISNKLQSTPEFKSSHFDQSNILAHLRVNDRVIDGKKTLFVEEVQSDWHQAGRKKGYKGDINEAAKEYTALLKEWGNKLASATPAEVTARLNELRPIVAKNATEAVPDAPFKTTWSDLSMKRVIQMASEGGYDRIAFTTGKTQAERYDLSKQIDELKISKDRDGNYTVGMYKVDADDEMDLIQSKYNIKESELEEVVGKDIAKKAIEGQRTFEGGDLTIGGEGMKGFYDDILPKFLDKYAKKWDAKTGVTDLVIEKTGSKYPPNIRTLEGGSVKRGSDKTVPVNYIDVTPKMRESVVTKGQPMFAIGAGGAGAAATQEENK